MEYTGLSGLNVKEVGFLIWLSCISVTDTGDTGRRMGRLKKRDVQIEIPFRPKDRAVWGKLYM